MDPGAWIVIEITFGLVVLTVIVLAAVIRRLGANSSRSDRDLSGSHSIPLQHRRHPAGLEDERAEPARGRGRHAA